MAQKKVTKPKPQGTKPQGTSPSPSQDPKPPEKNAKGDNLVKGLVIHCSGSDLPKHDNAATIDTWHKARGWKGIGYHWYIRRDGKLETGRPIDMDPYLESDEIGAHVLGENKRRLGVCLGGNGNPTKEQLKRLAKLFKDEVLDKNPNADLTGHNYWTDKKTCPNFDWRTWVGDNFPNALPA